MEEIKKLWAIIDYVQEKAKKTEVGSLEHRDLMMELTELLNKQSDLIDLEYEKTK